jgi:hypothetical protein
VGITGSNFLEKLLFYPQLIFYFANSASGNIGYPDINSKLNFAIQLAEKRAETPRITRKPTVSSL